MTKQESLTLSLAIYAILAKVRKQGLMSIECEIEYPDKSEILCTVPSDVLPLVCDILRLMVGGNLEPTDIKEYAAHMIENNTGWSKSSDAQKFVAQALLSACQGYAPQVCIEFARSTIPQKHRPAFVEMEDFVKAHKYDFDKKEETRTVDDRIAYVMKLLSA